MDLIGYRWYYRSSALAWADANGQAYREWLLRLKQVNKDALALFTDLVAELWDPLLGRPDAILPTPPSSAEIAPSDYPMAHLADAVAERTGSEHLVGLVVRERSLPRAVDDWSVRNARVQMESMSVRGELPEGIDSVVILDDVLTSGATIGGVMSCLRAELGERPVRVVGLALGKTQRTGSTPFPPDPEFPEPPSRSVHISQIRFE